ncbi:MAG: hypothetical protein IKS69_01040, partial [Erysipelotrichaceae bacterium]|nr:hypothetical protein [Erysipelotrichaceae bacterium]
IAIAGLLAVLAGALFLFTRPSNKGTYYLSEDKVQYVVGEKGIYFFEGGNKKAELPEVLPDTNSYSFDNRTLLFGGIKEEKNNLYIYRDGKVDLITDDFGKYTLSDSGEYVFYKSYSDDTPHLYQVKNKKDHTVTASEEEAARFGDYVLSYSGSVLAYTSDEEDGTKLHLYASSKDKMLPAEDVFELAAVSEKGEVFYHTSDGQLMVCDSKGTSLISDEYDTICANIDYSQIVAVGKEGFVLYENGRRSQGSFADVGGYDSILIPEKTLAIGYYQYNQGGLYAAFYHLGVSDFKQLFFLSENGSIFKIGKDLKGQVICEGATAYRVSSDGKTLLWLDEENNTHLYNGNNSDFFCGDEGINKIYAWDDQNKILYFSNKNKALACSDGKNVVTTSEYFDPSVYVCCSDGYFYFKEGHVLYAMNKSGEIVEVGVLYSSSSSGSSEDFYARNGIGFKGEDRNIYFVRNAKASRLKTGEDEENS